MVVVIARVQTDADRRAELVRIGQTLAAASRQEPGCISYQVCQDTEDQNGFVFVEQWETEEALQTHFRSSHIAEFMAAVPAAVEGRPDIKFHTVASSRDLADVGAG
jgi:quinol monooxygenase YgiN